MILSGNQAEFQVLENLTEDNWEKLLTLAKILGVTPLLYRQLVMRSNSSRIPEAVIMKLRDAYYRCHAKNAYLFHELGKLMGSFKQAEVPVILLKGAYLADSIYQDAGLRPMDDLDLLIPPEHILKGIEVLSTLGYQPFQEYSLDVEFDMAKHVPPYIKDNTIIELHWNIVNPESPIKFDTSGLWSRSLCFKKENLEALCLSQEDLLLHLCMHTTQHYFYKQLRTLCDIQALISLHSNDLNWDQVIHRAKDWHAERSVFLALYTVQSLLEVDIPDFVLKELKPEDFSEEIFGWAQKRIFQAEPTISDNFIAFLGDRSRKSRLIAFVEAMIPSRKIMSRIYGIDPGSWRVYLKYPSHWIDRIRRYGGRSVSMLQGDHKLTEQARIQQRLVEWLSQ